ncbi:glycosyltransferase [Hymenobacter sp. 5516J-16]|uniref:glycosyltransferase n=1 Tax=Hymenobacter sp. 5516J-16 TaxID=2932253 RepID=UPI001FD14A9D|nr:glycosyltransferase [Hymenobacter sp. 5516J-16]UOQ76172.1 glycosyltransferase [Hymenobacter sp. 5516J-16]
MDAPLVTVGVASYNNAAYLRETLESIRQQTYPNVEVLIVDDASTDESVAVARAWLAEHPQVRGRVIEHPVNRGICPACNTLVTQAQGEFICLIGSDDVYLPDKLAVQVPLLLNAPPEVGVITSAIEFMDSEGNTIPQPDDFAIPHPEEVYVTLLNSCVIAAMSTLVRRSCYEKVGLYDESLPFEDWDMWLRIAREYKFLYSPKVSARYRRHANAVFNSRRRQMEEGSLMLLNKNRGVSSEADAAIIRQTHLRSELLYQIGSPQAAHWLRVRWQDDRSLTSWVLYMCARLGIPGSAVMKAQRLLGRR